jgi:hypothetical protein
VSDDNSSFNPWEIHLPSLGVCVTIAGGYGTKLIHHSRIDLPFGVICRQDGDLFSFLSAIVLYIGREVAHLGQKGVSP